jgi:adenosylmethionine-8-amino-7-oxononanoate aminotransferase
MSRALIQNVLGANLPNIDRAEGVWLFDTEGKMYLDGCSGAVVTSIGHANPRVIEAMKAQSERVTYIHRGAFASEESHRLAGRLANATGYAGVWFVNSGSEAVEAAMQFALQYYREKGEERHWFLSQSKSYHGNTLGALSLSGHARRQVAGNLAHPFAELPAPYQYREGEGLSEEDYARKLLAQAEAAIAEHADELAGVVFEPVGGATLGSTVPPGAYVKGLRQLCDKYRVLLIADEVMTGLGRTGTLLGVDHWNVKPDLVAIGKGLGAGYTPIAGTLVNEEILETLTQGSGRILGGHTYAGNPLSIAIASAVVDVLFQDDLVSRAAITGKYLGEGLTNLADKHELIGDVRGLGMLHSIEFVQDRITKEVHLPQGSLAHKVASASMEEGLVIYVATGGFNDACQIAPALTITVHEVDELLARLDRALSKVERELRQQVEA